LTMRTSKPGVARPIEPARIGNRLELLPITRLHSVWPNTSCASMPKVSRLPEPVLPESAATRIHTFWLWLSRAVPKEKVLELVPNAPGSSQLSGPRGLMVYDAAWKYDQGRDIRAEAYMAKIFGDTQSFHAADRCMEIHGGMGLATDLPIEKFWRDQRSMMITEGPIEILKMTLARHVLRTYG